MSDKRLDRIAKQAKAILDAARAQARKGDVTRAEWEEPDPADVSTLAGMMMHLVMNEERLGSVPIPQSVAIPGSVNYWISGFHFPGHVDEHGAPVVCMLPPGVRRNVPPDALPVAIIIPPGQIEALRKTYPEMPS